MSSGVVGGESGLDEHFVIHDEVESESYKGELEDILRENLPTIAYMDGGRNQIVIEVDGGSMFQSYQTRIACVSNKGLVVLDNRADKWSRTTSRFLKEYLNAYTKGDTMSLDSFLRANLN